MPLRSVRGAALSILCAVLLGISALSAHASDVNGRIRGTVTDPSSAVVAGTAVVATNQATGVKFTTTTNKEGEYLFPELPTGTYTVTVTMAGFKKFEAKGITLNIDQEFVEPIQLSVGSTGDTIEVAADSVQVNTSDMQLNNVINSAQLVELPLIGRNFTLLELTLPGVQASSDRFGTFSVSGSQTQQSEYLINGADANDLALNTLAIVPNLDAIEQFNLIDGPLNAEYDRNSGGIVSATIKQGTNRFHGDIFEFYRDTFLNTNNWFQKSFNAAGQRTDTVATFHQNIFGGTIGGPILKDKLFFFGAYQGIRQVVPEAGGSVNVFSAANLTGSFTEDLAANSPTANHFGDTFSSRVIPGTITALAALNPLCVPNGTNTWGPVTTKVGGVTTTTPGCLDTLGGKVPTSAFNSISAGLAKSFVPLPNNTGVSPYSYIFHPVVTTKADQYIGRIDYALNSKNQFTGLGIRNHQVAPETLPFTGASLPGFGDVSTTTVQQYTFDFVHQFNSTTVNDLSAHWTRFNFQAVFPQTPAAPSTAGFAVNPQNTAGEGLPTIALTSFFTLGFSTNGPQPRIDQVYQLDDTVSTVIGRHNLKMGYDGRRFNVSNPFSARNNGSYAFSTSTATSPFTTGDSSLDFLLGIPGTFGQSSGATIQADAYLNYMFAQDTWKVTNTFTLNYGMGYSIDTPLRQHQYNGKAVLCLNPGQTSTVFPTAPKGLAYPGDPGCTISAAATTHYSEFGPRLGFAYSPDWGFISGAPGKFSIRGGFGIYYDRSEEESSLETLTTPPFGLTSAGVNDYGTTTTLTPSFANPYMDINTGTVYANKFPYTFPTPGQAINFAKLEPIAKSTYAAGFRAPYAENFQLSMEREFPSRVVARVSYVGSLARRNQIDFEGNPITPAGRANCLATPACSANTNAANPLLGPQVPSNGSNQMKVYPQNTAYGSIDPLTGNTGFTSIGEDGSEGTSNYHALQASVTKAPSHGLAFQLSYTFAHAMDNGSSFENSGFGSSGRGYNQFVQSLNYGNAAFDTRHRLVFAPIYISTFKSTAAWYTPLNLALSGWQVSGIATVATGQPFDISYAGTISNSLYCASSNQFYACPDVPVQNGPLVRVNPRLKTLGALTGDRWFDNQGLTFTPEPIGTFGNTYRNQYHGPGINSTNLILAKNFNLSSDGVRRIQIGMESDNVFNHTQFSNPGSTVGAAFNPAIQGGFASGFGQITAAAAARQTQLRAKIYF
ncbi:MAG TPA: carboxypeptidase-like regulatory domain-containing protein [Acidobacteriaceae bacterium]|nr:carboxypeptidase-like regulatory domain-containing protein [Acidobacteriaceae bacterium]